MHETQKHLQDVLQIKVNREINTQYLATEDDDSIYRHYATFDLLINKSLDFVVSDYR